MIHTKLFTIEYILDAITGNLSLEHLERNKKREPHPLTRKGAGRVASKMRGEKRT